MPKGPNDTWAECWEARVPLRLELAASDVTALKRPPPLYVQARRFSFLPTVAQQALAFFQHVLPPGEDTPWFEYRRLPLPWTVPLGVLLDLLAAGPQERPWPLTVHFRAFPAQSLLQWRGRDSLKAAYFNALKEAANICQGSAQAVNGITEGAQRDLWAAVEGGDPDVFRAVSGGLRLTPKARGERPPCIPLRLYVAESSAGYTSNLRDAVRHTSRPVRALTAAGEEVTLGAALQALLPSLLPGDGPQGGPAPEDAPGGSAAAGALNGAEGAEAPAGAPPGAASPPGPPAGEGQGAGEGELRVGERTAVLSICGVRPPLAAPLAWLHAHMHQADHFLYVTAVLQG